MDDKELVTKLADLAADTPELVEAINGVGERLAVSAGLEKEKGVLQASLKNTEGTLNGRIAELETAAVTSDATVKTLTAKLEEASGDTAKVLETENTLKAANEELEKLRDRVVTGLNTDLTTLGVSEDDLKDKGVDILEAMKVAATAAKTQGGGGTGLGLQGGGGEVTPGKLTPLQEASEEMVVLMQNAEAGVKIVQ